MIKRLAAVIFVLLACVWFSEEANAQNPCGQTNVICWTTANRPSPPTAGTFGYNTSVNRIEYYNGTIWVQLDNYNIDVKALGAKGDTITATDGTISSGSTSFSSASAKFTSNDCVSPGTGCTGPVNKSIVIDGAGVAGAPLVTTIVGFTSSTNVTLALAASTTVPYFFLYGTIPLTLFGGTPGSGYVPGDTISDGNFTSVIAYTQVTAVARNADGSSGVTSTGSTSGTCRVQGTRGTAGMKFTADVTLTAGAISAIVGVVEPGVYSAFTFANLTAEPVVPIGGCVNLAGATLNLTMGGLLVRPTTRGNYTTAPPDPLCAAPACSTSGSGTGMRLVPQQILAGSYMYGTDDTAAISSIMTASNAGNVLGNRSCVTFPAGAYFISSALPKWTTPGCVEGVDWFQSFIMASPALSGDVFSWQEIWLGGHYAVNGGIANILKGQAPGPPGPSISNISIYGDRGTSNTQNGLVFYDWIDHANVHDVNIYNMKGYGIAVGILNTTARGVMRESNFNTIRIFHSGDPTHPAWLFETMGANDGTDTIKVSQVDIFAPYGPGLKVRSTGPSITNGIYMDNVRVEGLQFYPEVLQGDLLAIGDSTSLTVNTITCYNCLLVDPYPDAAAIKMDVAGGSDIYNIDFRGNIGGGLGYGSGLNINKGRTSNFQFAGISTHGYNIVASASAGGDNEIRGIAGGESAWTYSVPTNFSMARYVSVYGPPLTGSSPIISLSRGDGTVANGNTVGAGSVALSTIRNQATQQATGTSATVLGGQFLTASGAGCAVVGGNAGNCSGNFSYVAGGSVNTASGAMSLVSGERTYDRGWYGGRCHASGSFTTVQGMSQTCDQVLRCLAALDATCVLTADGGAQGAANIVNIPINTIYTLKIDCSAVNNTTPANNETWANWTGKLERQAGNAVLTMAALPTGVVSGTFPGAPNLAAVADTTNQGLQITFTAPTTGGGGVAGTYHVTCRVQTHQVQ